MGEGMMGRGRKTRCSVESSIGRLFEAGGDDADEGYIFIWCKVAEIRRGLFLKIFRKVIYSKTLSTLVVHLWQRSSSALEGFKSVVKVANWATECGNIGISAKQMVS